MKKFMKVSIYVIAFLALVLISGWVFRGYLLKRALPEYNGKFKLTGLKAKVDVYRDTFAIPHIFAQNEEDLYFVTGYLTAQDRLWQMDLLRRVTSGRLSEIFGEKLVKTDMLMRMLRIPNKSRKILAQTDSAVLKALKSYADGVNFYIEQNAKKLPPEFAILGYKPEKWEPEHSLNLIGYIAWDLNGSWNSEIFIHQISGKLSNDQVKEFIPDIASQKKLIFSGINNDKGWCDEMAATSDHLKDLGLQVFHGSNNWVVSGKKTTTGMPILANDMHLGFGAPGVWYQIHQVVDGQLDVTGVLLPGQPFVVSGHNARIAWGLTNVMNDDIDFYKETINPDDSNFYKLDGKWIPFVVKKEAIAVKGKDTVWANIRFTHRGPVISGMKEVKDEVISMRWVGNEMSNEVRSIFYLNRAGNWNDFGEAMKTFISVSQNVAYADVDGNIGMYCCAGIPIRKSGNPMDIFPGDTTASDWLGLVPFDELPHSYNPPSGYAISANNRTISDNYPYYISYWFDLSYRYNRILKFIENDSAISPARFEAIQTDQVSDLVVQYKSILIDELSKSDKLSSSNKDIIESLKQWSGEYDASNSNAAIFETFYNKFIENLLSDELGENLYKTMLTDKIVLRNVFHNTWIKRGSVLCDNIKTPEVETFSDLTLRSFSQTVESLTKQFGEDRNKWVWGKLHTITFEHPLGKVKVLDKIFGLNRGPFPIGGSFHTVAPFTYKYFQPFSVTSGASQRHIYDVADWDKSMSVIPTGNSGIPSSPFYCDQTSLYLKGLYHSDVITRDKVMARTKYFATFEP
jgi:penicillin amidase